MPAETLGHTLLVLARNAIGERFGIPPQALPHADELKTLDEPGATFVTLSKEGALRGCIGSLQAQRPLREDVHANALAAAFADPRFPPLERKEFSAVRIEVSLLGTADSMDFSSEADALAQLRPHVDGLILSHGSRCATFLPQVWESLLEPAHFMAQLKMKAGLAPDLWDEHIRLARYEVRKWKETN